MRRRPLEQHTYKAVQEHIMANQIYIVSDLNEMNVAQLLEYKDFIERLFERVRDAHFEQVPLPNQVSDAWRECVKTIDAIQEALFLKQQ